MKPIRRATLIQTTERGVELDCGDGITCRVSVLKPDLVRVLFREGAAPRQPRTWMVPAEGSADVPWQGRDRLDETSWPAVGQTLTQEDGAITLSTPALSVRIGLAPLALIWSLPDGTVFAADRSNHAYLFGDRIRHHHARDAADRYHGLGDKTRPARPARPPAAHDHAG